VLNKTDLTLTSSKHHTQWQFPSGNSDIQKKSAHAGAAGAAVPIRHGGVESIKQRSTSKMSAASTPALSATTSRSSWRNTLLRKCALKMGDLPQFKGSLLDGKSDGICFMGKVMMSSFD
jgi:hypothetical protein